MPAYRLFSDDFYNNHFLNYNFESEEDTEKFIRFLTHPNNYFPPNYSLGILALLNVFDFYFSCDEQSSFCPFRYLINSYIDGLSYYFHGNQDTIISFLNDNKNIEYLLRSIYEYRYLRNYIFDDVKNEIFDINEFEDEDIDEFEEDDDDDDDDEEEEDD